VFGEIRQFFTRSNADSSMRKHKATKTSQKRKLCPACTEPSMWDGGDSRSFSSCLVPGFEIVEVRTSIILALSFSTSVGASRDIRWGYARKWSGADCQIEPHGHWVLVVQWGWRRPLVAVAIGVYRWIKFTDGSVRSRPFEDPVRSKDPYSVRSEARCALDN
jgi:hypothetical protein